MAEVYLAEDTELGRRVALTLLVRLPRHCGLIYTELVCRVFAVDDDFVKISALSNLKLLAVEDV